MNRIKEFRQQANLTQADLALEMGCDQSTVSKYECGDRQPDLGQIKKLISIFARRGVRADFFALFPCDSGDTAA